MTYEFKKAVREEVGLLIGLISPSGGGKTYSAMRIASGIVGKGNRFAVIDTESRRALHYAGMFDFDHCELHPPFKPETYTDAIKAADQAGYRAIVVDSVSHEWAGEGGILDWQEEELTRMAGEDYHKREACKMASWIKPKGSHKQMVQKLLQVKAHLILCFRAEEKLKMQKDAQGKMQIIPMGFQPICSKEMPYELTVSFLLNVDKPGIPQPIKLQEQHKPMFPASKLLDETCGQLISAWAKGATAQDAPGSTIPAKQGETGGGERPPDSPLQSEKSIANRQALERLFEKEGMDRAAFMEYLDSIFWRTDGMITDFYVDKLLKPANWKSIMGAFGKYIDQKNAEASK
jgi:hypothetical protein